MPGLATTFRQQDVIFFQPQSSVSFISGEGVFGLLSRKLHGSLSSQPLLDHVAHQFGQRKRTQSMGLRVNVVPCQRVRTENLDPCEHNRPGLLPIHGGHDVGDEEKRRAEPRSCGPLLYVRSIDTAIRGACREVLGHSGRHGALTILQMTMCSSLMPADDTMWYWTRSKSLKGT